MHAEYWDVLSICHVKQQQQQHQAKVTACFSAVS